MEYVRVINPRDFDHTLLEFNDLAFKQYGAGLSCFEVGCAIQTSGSVCDHIRQYYPNLTGDPAVYFRFRIGDMPQNAVISPTDVGNRDPCHNDVTGVSKKSLRKLRHRPITDYQICDPTGPRSLTVADTLNWK